MSNDLGFFRYRDDRRPHSHSANQVCIPGPEVVKPKSKSDFGSEEYSLQRRYPGSSSIVGSHLAVRYLSSRLESGQAVLEPEISEPDGGLEMVESYAEAPQQ